MSEIGHNLCRGIATHADYIKNIKLQRHSGHNFFWWLLERLKNLTTSHTEIILVWPHSLFTGKFKEEKNTSLEKKIQTTFIYSKRYPEIIGTLLVRRYNMQH
jgi:hypothetical protein